MASCRDCIHYSVCHQRQKSVSLDPMKYGYKCLVFKDKSRYIEVPCKVGDVVYRPIITSRGKPAIWAIKISKIDIDINSDGVSPDSFAIGTLVNTHCGEAVDFREFGKDVFLTKKEAEKAQAERFEK